MIPNLLRVDRTREDPESQMAAYLIDIYIGLKPEENFEAGKTGLQEEIKVKRGGRGTTKKYMMRTGKRAGLSGNKNTNIMFITSVGKRSEEGQGY